MKKRFYVIEHYNDSGGHDFVERRDKGKYTLTTDIEKAKRYSSLRVIKENLDTYESEDKDDYIGAEYQVEYKRINHK